MSVTGIELLNKRVTLNNSYFDVKQRTQLRRHTGKFCARGIVSGR